MTTAASGVVRRPARGCSGAVEQRQRVDVLWPTRRSKTPLTARFLLVLRHRLPARSMMRAVSEPPPRAAVARAADELATSLEVERRRRVAQRSTRSRPRASRPSTHSARASIVDRGRQPGPVFGMRVVVHRRLAAGGRLGVAQHLAMVVFGLRLVGRQRMHLRRWRCAKSARWMPQLIAQLEPARRAGSPRAPAARAPARPARLRSALNASSGGATSSALKPGC